MELNRRDFLKLSGAAVGSIPALEFLGNRGMASARSGAPVMEKRVGEKSSVCAFCAGGCGILVGVEGDKITSTEGDPDHPINQGAICSKSQAMTQVRTVSGHANPYRLTPVLYRAPNSQDWEEKSWDWVLSEIAMRVKQTRDNNWIEKDEAGVIVNRTEAIAQIGGSAHDNEECYLISKMNRALGLVYTETQARI